MCGSCIPIEGGFLCVGGPEYKIRVRDKVYAFEMHRYCGPIFLNKDGGSKMSGIYNYHYAAVQAWINKGKQIDDQGFCIWEAETISLTPRKDPDHA